MIERKPNQPVSSYIPYDGYPKDVWPGDEIVYPVWLQGFVVDTYTVRVTSEGIMVPHV